MLGTGRNAEPRNVEFVKCIKRHPFNERDRRAAVPTSVLACFIRETLEQQVLTTHLSTCPQLMYSPP